MKQTTILITIIACITFFACKNPLKPGSQAQPSNFIATDSIPGIIADSMIIHFLDTVLVDHSLASIIRQTTLQNSDLDKIFKIKGITRLRLFAAAYLNSDSVVARRNKLTVLVQLKQGYNSNYYYFDAQDLGPNRICPPPNMCTIYEN